MTPETKAALEASIESWKSRREAVDPEDVPMGVKACPLCAIFYKDTECTGCPVQQHTGLDLCMETPYSNAFDALAAWRQSPGSIAMRDAWRAAAGWMVLFLEARLPDDD